MFKQKFIGKFVMIHFKNLVSSFSTQEKIYDILTTHLKLDYNIIKKNDKIEKNNLINKIPIQRVIQNCNIIKVCIHLNNIIIILLY